MVKLVTVFNDSALTKFVYLLSEESNVLQVGFYDIHTLSKKEKISPPKIDDLKKKLAQKGYSCVRAHCLLTGIKTNAPEKEVISILKHI